MTTTERPRQNTAFSSRELAQWRTEPIQQVPPEENYYLPDGVSGTMKELLADPIQATRSIHRAQKVMRALYEVTLVDADSREEIEGTALSTRMGIVRDIFNPDSIEKARQAELNAERMIATAAVIYNRGRSDLPLKR